MNKQFEVTKLQVSGIKDGLKINFINMIGHDWHKYTKAYSDTNWGKMIWASGACGQGRHFGLLGLTYDVMKTCGTDSIEQDNQKKSKLLNLETSGTNVASYRKITAREKWVIEL